MSTSHHITLDAHEQPLGRLASTVARYLRGKHLVSYRPDRLPGIHVTVRGVRNLRLTSRHAKRPVHRFSGYPGGLKTTTLTKTFQADPDAAFRRVVRRMLPDNRLRRRLLRFLHTTP